ncbi:MAG: HD domain-containing protein [Clostridiales bacterium]|nr:HD domain-containing protein [Clostridiales bacterium]
MRYIKDMREGEMVRDIYFCKSVQTLKAKTGKSYMSLNLQDKSGTIDGKVWEINSGISHFEAMDYIMIDGQVTSFQGANQLNIRRIRKADESEYSVDDYMPCTEKNIDEMYKELTGLIGTVKQPHLRELLESFFIADKTFADMFKKHSAAKSVHHNFIGGLLEHTLGVAKLCSFFADTYPMLNRDLLVSAAIFHDIGKLKELSTFPENDYTDDGNLLGHIFMGTEMIGERIKTISGFPPVLAGELKHCILAHHGELEFGSPKKPAIAEALALSMADNLDAKMESFRELFSTPEASNGWLGFQRIFDSNVRATQGK